MITPEVITKFFTQDQIIDLLIYAIRMSDPTCIVEGRTVEDVELESDRYDRISAKVFLKLKEDLLVKAEEDDFQEFDTIDDVVNADGGYMLEVDLEDEI